MKFVHVSIRGVFLPLFVMLAASCGDEGGHRNGPASRRDWRTSSSLTKTEPSNTSDMVMQARLKGLGYDPGPIDGLVDTQTKMALMRYQRDHGLLATGFAGPATRAHLMPASLRLTDGYGLLGVRHRGMPAGPRYPGDIRCHVGTGDTYGLSPCKGTNRNFYRILRPERNRIKQTSASFP